MTEPVTLDTIQAKAVALASLHRVLASAALTLETKLADVRRQHTPTLRKYADQARAAEEELLGLVEGNPDLFQRPKSREFEGIKLGWKKGKGKITFDDEEKLIKLIRKLRRPDLEEQLIATKETVEKSALGELDAEMLKRLGVTVEGAGDQPFVKHVDTSVQKLVAILLGAEAEEP